MSTFDNEVMAPGQQKKDNAQNYVTERGKKITLMNR